MNATATLDTYTQPTPDEMEEFRQVWGTWQQREQVSRKLTNYRLRDRWDEYTKRGRVEIVGGAMATAQKAIDDGYSAFFSTPDGRDYFLHYYVHTHAHLITAAFLEGFYAHALSKGVQATMGQVQKWVGNKLADMVWTGYFREQQAYENLSREDGWTIRHTTNYEDKMKALDFVRWSPELFVEEGIQVKAVSFLRKLAKGDTGLLDKVVRCHQDWSREASDRCTYIYIDITGQQVHNSQRQALRYMLATLKLAQNPIEQKVGSRLYMIITTS